MSDKTKKSNHEQFLAVVDDLREKASKPGAIELSFNDALIIIEEGDWVKNYTEAQRDRAKKNTNAGRNKKPDSEIKPESLRKRELRAMKKKD